MEDLPFDAQERLALCDLFEELGPNAPTLLEGWTAKDLAAHLVLRERDLLAGPCLVLPGPFQRFASRRQTRLTQQHEFDWLVERIRSGPPPGFFRLGWVRSFPSLNEFFVHHEDLRRANGRSPRSDLTPALETALWHNVCRGSRYLSRRLRGIGLEIQWAATTHIKTIRPTEPVVRISGPPGELLIYFFGRQTVAQIELAGPADAVAACRRARFGL
ncbi:TIGR03085 family metal-binding protein [Nocardia sp. NPDC059764]|uniref:TIGR03085 family metal-binding protein n=1 Tax=Nocardia sp. NPDC059764 TaxID=3346939 RepID=UPI0036597F9E